MSGRVTITPRARQDLEEILKFSSKNWGAERAKNYIRKFAFAFEDLLANPTFGRSAEEVRPGYLRWTVGSHVVFYRRQADDCVVIVRILHSRMDPDRHL